jgi:hypothetical protein
MARRVKREAAPWRRHQREEATWAAHSAMPEETDCQREESISAPAAGQRPRNSVAMEKAASHQRDGKAQQAAACAEPA